MHKALRGLRTYHVDVSYLDSKGNELTDSDVVYATSEQAAERRIARLFADCDALVIVQVEDITDAR